MTNYEAVSKVEGFCEGENATEAERIEALQELINSGMAWTLQGSTGRAAMDAIEAGLCILGETGHRDYYGNYVPSRHEVKAGTKGSVEYQEKMLENS